MKTLQATLLLLLSCAGCVLEDTPARLYHLDGHYPSVLDFDLRAGVKSLNINTFEATAAGELVNAGPLLEKKYHEFNPIGLCTKTISYEVLPSRARESYAYTYTYDAQTRVTRELLEEYTYPGELLTVNVIDRRYHYDDEARTATCLEYAGNETTGYTLVAKRVYTLKENGHIFWGVSDDYVSPTRATGELNMRRERVVIARDARDNWTESYIRETHGDTTPAPATYLYDYTKRDITYY
jgi:hypothetical protein